MKKLLLLVSAALLIGLVTGCSKLGNPAVDDTAPTVSSTTPADGATRVAANVDITVTFSEEMDEGSAEDAFTITPSISGSFSWDGNTMTFSSDTGSLSYDTAYTCTVGTGAKDLQGNYLASAKTWSFTTIYSDDTDAPTISSVTPSSGAENVAVLPTIEVDFDEEMNESSVQSAFLINSATPTGTFNWVENTMFFTPGSALSYSTTYTCTVGTGAEDLTGNALASAKIWSFTTESSDTTAPTVILANPSDYSTEIAVSSTVSLTFSEGMNKSSVEGAFSISPSVSGNIDWAGYTMTFTPGSNLDTDTTYTCTVDTGATDLAANPMAADYTSYFTTVLTVAPTVVSVSPSADETNVPVTTSTISATFSQPMKTSSLSSSANPALDGTMSWDDFSKIVTFTVNGNLASNTTYTCSIRAKNIAGINMAATYTWSFTTAP